MINSRILFCQIRDQTEVLKPTQLELGSSNQLGQSPDGERTWSPELFDVSASDHNSFFIKHVKSFPGLYYTHIFIIYILAKAFK